MAVMFAAADAAGVTSLPRRVETGFAIIDKDKVKDPAVARFIYQTRASSAACLLMERVPSRTVPIEKLPGGQRRRWRSRAPSIGTRGS